MRDRNKKRRHSKTVPSHDKGHHRPKNNLKAKPLKIIKGESKLTEHHRRPRSLGGTKIQGNMSFVQMYIHKAWHIIFGNMNPEQICNLININFKPKGLTLICVPINGDRCLRQGTNDSRSDDFEKISLAWNTLFEKQMTFRQKIAYINNVLLDPAYHFYIKD